jgi:hypothetical protein
MWCYKCNMNHIGSCPEKDNSFLNLTPKYEPIKPIEPIFPKYELPKYDLTPKQPEIYYCGELGCPGHFGYIGRCPPTPGPGCRLGPVGGPTW